MPPKLSLKGEAVFLCCSTCKDKAEADPDKALQAIADVKAGYEFFCPMHPQIVRYRHKEKCPICSMPLSKKKREDTNPLPAAAPGTLSPEDFPKIRASLEKLSPADQKAAEGQWLCPVQGDVLGSMGVPVKVTLKGQAVFLCCKGCVGKAEKDPDAVLKKVDELRRQFGPPKE